MPALIYKRFHEDDYAGKIYELIQHESNQDAVLLTDDNLIDDKKLFKQYVAIAERKC